MHAGYSLGGEPLEEARKEKNLGVLVDHRLSNIMHYQATANKASRLSCFKMGIYSRDKNR